MEFPLEFDHITMLVSPEAPERVALEELGLREGGMVVDQGGFGMRSRFYYFENTYLELFWLADHSLANRVMATLGLDVGSRERWRELGASPFGLVFRRNANLPLPFPTQSLPATRGSRELFLEFNSEIPYEPWNIVIPEPLHYKPGIRPVNHPLGVRRVSKFKIGVAETQLSPTARLINQWGLVALEPASEPLLELTFDDGKQGTVFDVRPTLPLVLHS